jgi:flagellar biosynthetic protein FliQ
MMEMNSVTELMQQALTMTVLLALPVLGIGLVVALVISVFQAVTQIHDQTLNLVPRILSMLLALVVLGPWMMERIVEFGREMFGQLP